MGGKRTKADESKNSAPEKWEPSRADAVVVARTPVLPFDVVLDWGRDLDATSRVADWLRASPDAKRDLEAQVAAALARDRDATRRKIRALIDHDPRVREALFIASPSLVERLEDWLRDPTSEAGARVEAPLFRYVTRMASRAMAFGLFAGTTVGRFGPTTDTSALDGRGFRRRSDIDVFALYRLTEKLIADPEVRRSLVYRQNATSFVFGSHYRFLANVTRNDLDGFDIALVERDEYADAAYARAKDGASFAELVATIERLNVATEDAEAYVHQLIDEQLLMTDLQPTPSAADPVGLLLERLREKPPTAALAQRLASVRKNLAQLDDGFGHPPSQYREILAPLSGLPGLEKPERAVKSTLLKTDPQLVLGEPLVRDLARTVEFLRRVAGDSRRGRDEMQAFVRDFQARYEGRSVPLLEALDPDSGVGFGESPIQQHLLTDLPIGGRPDPSTVAWSAWTKTLFAKLLEATRKGEKTLTLSDADVEGLGEPRAAMPDVLDVSVRVGRNTAADARDPYQLHFVLATGPQSGVIASRFAFDDDVRSRLERIYAAEAERSDGIVAELIHFARGPAAYALTRRAVRPYEIPCPDAPSVADDHVLPLSDLELRIVGDRMHVYSRRHQKRVFPRLTTAHSFRASPCGVYKFLAALQSSEERTTLLAFSWGPLSAAPFLPRVVYRNVVLQRAAWRLDEDDIAPLTKGDADRRFLAAQALRARRNLPRYVVVTELDQEFIADLDNPLCVAALLDVIGDEKVATLEEMLPGPDELVGSAEHGWFVNDLRLTLLTERAQVERAQEAPRHLAPPPARSAEGRQLRPGSDCLFVKLYTGTDASQDLLCQVIAPFIARHRARFARWFFLCYGDPEWHVRLRVFGDPTTLHDELWPALRDELAKPPWDVRVHRVDLSTYDRELERYGGEAGIVLSEQLFSADSESALALLCSDLPPEERWKVALVGTHRLIQDLGFTGKAALDVVTRARAGLRQEFGKANDLDHGLSKRFRTERADLEAMLRGEGERGAFARAVFDVRSAAIAAPAAALQTAEREGRLYGTLSTIVWSYVHMSILRLLPQNNRAHEYALLDFLERLLTSQLARGAR